MFIGRREDFAFTLTSAGADIIDHYVETLCDGSDTKYLYKGQCRDMERFDAGKLTGTDGETRPVVFNRTVHGPVIGYATVAGRRVAISRKRVELRTRHRGPAALPRHHQRTINGPRDLFRAASQSPQTFNTFYVDHRNVAMYTSGSLPLRAQAPSTRGCRLTAVATTSGAGTCRPASTRRASTRAAGCIVNWNNKPAAEFPGADDQFGYGTIGRVDLLNGRLKAAGKHNNASIVSALNAAATHGCAAADTCPCWPRSCAPAPRRALGRTRMLRSCWRSGATRGSSRLDVDLDGKIDDPGAAVMDAA